ncbi:YybH family protein [Crossiella sp. NPDC003009]
MDHNTSVRLTTDPGQHPHVFAAAFNTGDPAAVEQVYEPGGLLAPQPGNPVTGQDRLAANARLQALGHPIEVRPRHTYVVDDLALLIVDWEIPGAGISGTATDVARRGPDGWWRYVIDNPHGCA